jgi:TolB-like protein/DNA-binding winged helix-turn-helix (wHTH) protein/Tfp pilus assembly protein PilF
MPSVLSNLYEFGEFRLDAQNRVLQNGGRPVAITPKAFEVLLLLIQHSGQVVSKDELMRTVWPDSFVEESNLTQTVFMLRKGLGETPDRRYILTVQGRGYRFAPDVKEVFEPPKRDTLSPQVRTENFSAYTADQPQLRLRTSWLLAGICLMILAAGLAAYFRKANAPVQNRQPRVRVMLAVLPFQNLTGDPAQEYFSDGLTEEMISHLGVLDPKSLGVIARTSVMHYKKNQSQLDQIGRELGVQYVLEGSVRRDPGKVRISAQLVQTSDQTHLWARQYDRELNNLLGLQDEIAQEIGDEIQLTFSQNTPGQKKTAVSSAKPQNPKSYEAFDFYLKGRYFWNKRSLDGFEQAIKYFQQAIAKDPDYALAYAGLADSYALLPGYSMTPQTELLPKARAAALKALQLDEGLAEAHTSLALITENYDWDWQTAEKEYLRAIELNPNYATAHHWYAEYLTWVGRFDEALRESERARQLDPLSLIIASDNAMIFYYSRQYNRAAKGFNAVLEMDPAFPRARMIRVVDVETGQFAEAMADIDKYTPNNYWDKAYTLGRAGRMAEAQHAFEELKELSRHRPVDPAAFAWACVGMGKKDEALAWLDKAYARHSNSMSALKIEPGWDPLRGDPRFQRLMQKVGLAQ